MVYQQLQEDLKTAATRAGFESTDPVLSISENTQFGDYTTNIALRQAKQDWQNLYHSSIEIANAVIENFGHPYYLERVDIAGPGFINFFVKPQFIAQDLEEVVLKGADFGRSLIGQGKKIQVDFISANPTGPLTLANGRGGALGQALANVLDFCGYQVETEYYVNDTGNQVRLLGESVLAKLGYVEPRGDHYQGDYIQTLAEKNHPGPGTDPQLLGEELARQLLVEQIKPSLNRFGVKFSRYFSEKALHRDGSIQKTADLLVDKGLAYERDGALWFKASRFGDDKDRVLITSLDQRGRREPTYYLADIAYHLNVLDRGFDEKINILGADHHGYAQRIVGVMEALGHPDFLKIVMIQLVRLFKAGREVRMSKRAGTFVTLDQLLQEVPADVAKFFFLMHAPTSQIDFDLDLAKQRSSKNPVFYVQYAYARLSGILAQVGDRQRPGQADPSLLVDKQETALIKHLLFFPELLQNLATSSEVHRLTEYSIKLADLFHRFYEFCPVLSSDEKLRHARLELVFATKVVLGNALNLMGLKAPERM